LALVLINIMKKEAALGAVMVGYTMKKRLLIIGGAIMLAIGFAGAIPFGSMVIEEAAQQELNPTTQRPQPIFFGIISPLYAEMAFMIIGVVGFSFVVLGGAMHQEEEQSKQLRREQQRR
jgi:hypothetical protein